MLSGGGAEDSMDLEALLQNVTFVLVSHRDLPAHGGQSSGVQRTIAVRTGFRVAEILFMSEFDFWQEWAPSFSDVDFANAWQRWALSLRLVRCNSSPCPEAILRAVLKPETDWRFPHPHLFSDTALQIPPIQRASAGRHVVRFVAFSPSLRVVSNTS
ncbi:MAG: hypothetical protein DMG02_26215 [Acidobacteria bacterium]|nr:MAG: hypothetical protein DMG02_26215 [Acidobacteriota bacterium]